MDIIEFISNINPTLEQYYLFRATKFILALYLIIMSLTVILMLIRMVQKGFITVLATGQGFPKVSKGQYQKEWNNTVSRLHTEDENEWKAAIIEAGNFLNDVLGIVKYQGNTLVEKLEGMNNVQLSNLDDAKEAARIRVEIVKDQNYALNKQEAMDTVEKFGRSLQFFEAIE